MSDLTAVLVTPVLDPGPAQLCQPSLTRAWWITHENVHGVVHFAFQSKIVWQAASFWERLSQPTFIAREEAQLYFQVRRTLRLSHMFQTLCVTITKSAFGRLQACGSVRFRPEADLGDYLSFLLPSSSSHLDRGN